MTQLAAPVAKAFRELAGRGESLNPLQFSHKLMDGPTPQYALNVEFSTPLEIDQSEMSMVIPFADGSRRDGVGDLLEIGGIRLDRHRKNPVVLFDHGKQVTLPIAMALKYDKSLERYDIDDYKVWLLPEIKQAKLQAYFYQGKGLPNIDRKQDYDHAVLCEQIFDMACKGMIRGGSIGYQVIKGLPLQPDYETGVPQGLHLLVTLMLEGSLVVMPANMDTVVKGLYGDLVDRLSSFVCKGQCCGKNLSPYLVKSLTPYVAEKKAQLGYEGKDVRIRRSENPNSNRHFVDVVAEQGDYPSFAPGELVSTHSRDSVEEARQEASEQALRHKRRLGADRVTITDTTPKPQKRPTPTPAAKPISGGEAADTTRKSTPVPLRELPKTRIPYARWKPGAGAIKSWDGSVSTLLEIMSQQGVNVLSYHGGTGQDHLSVVVPNEQLNQAQEIIQRQGAYGKVSVISSDKHLKNIRDRYKWKEIRITPDSDYIDPKSNASTRARVTVHPEPTDPVVITPRRSHAHPIAHARELANETAQRYKERMGADRVRVTDNTREKKAWEPAETPQQRTRRLGRLANIRARQEARLGPSVRRTRPRTPEERAVVQQRQEARQNQTKSQFPGDLQFWQEEQEEREHQNIGGKAKEGPKRRTARVGDSVRVARGPGFIRGHTGQVTNEDYISDEMDQTEQPIHYTEVRNPTGIVEYPRDDELIITRRAGQNSLDMNSKALHSLRKKYRSIKGLRRKLKRSSSGSSVIHVLRNDVDDLKEKAGLGGVEVKWMGSHGSLDKLKLTGDDSVIDNLTREFGRRKL